MKKLFKFIGVAVIGLATVCLQPAFASGSPVSFNITNTLDSSTSITSWPTNSSGTNGLPTLTGTAVAIYNQRSIGLNLQGSYVCTTTNGGALTFTFVTSQAANGPAVVYDTNGFCIQNDWATDGAGKFTLVVPLTTPATIGTNWFNWQTNYDNPSIVSDANYIGVRGITSTLSGATLKSAVLTANKKLIPTPLIGQ